MTKSDPLRPIEIAAFLSIAASLGLFILRFWFNISFQRPLQITTSGMEEASLYSIWRVIYQKPVYTDPFKIPFTAAYFNWLFYFIYGHVTKIILCLFSLSDAWIPTLTKLISVMFCCFGSWISFKIYTFCCTNHKIFSTHLMVALALYSFFNPLIGYWAMTARGDVMALCFELLAFYSFVRLHRSSFFWSFISTIIFSYGAWACKQTNIAAMIGITIYCLLNQNKRLGVMILLGNIVLIMFSLYVGGKDYRYNTLFSLMGTPMNLVSATKLFIRSAMKQSWTIIFFGYVGFWLKNRTARIELANEPLISLTLLIVGVAFTTNFMASMKCGASDNYYFSCYFFTSLAALQLFEKYYLLTELQRKTKAFWILGWALQSLAVLAVFSGGAGTISQLSEHEQLVRLIKCAEKLPKPIFVERAYYHLPWISNSVPFVIAFNYQEDRIKRKKFERNGIGGLIDDGYFLSLVFNRKDETFDRSDLSKYKAIVSECPGVAFVKRNSS